MSFCKHVLQLLANDEAVSVATCCATMSIRNHLATSLPPSLPVRARKSSSGACPPALKIKDMSAQACAGSKKACEIAERCAQNSADLPSEDRGPIAPIIQGWSTSHSWALVLEGLPTVSSTLRISRLPKGALFWQMIAASPDRNRSCRSSPSTTRNWTATCVVLAVWSGCRSKLPRVLESRCYMR